MGFGAVKILDINGLSYLYTKLNNNIESFQENTKSIIDTAAAAANSAADRANAVTGNIDGTYATKEELKTSIDKITSFEFNIVTVLPSEGVKGTIYLMENTGNQTAEENIYDEYIWVGGKYEKIGTTDINFSKYSTSQEIADAYLKIADAAKTYATKGEVATIDSKVDANTTSISTHAGNTTVHITADERKNWNDAKTHADSAHARTDATKVEKSTTNGNIKIDGTETNVYTHPAGTNPHGTTKADVGLEYVGNFKAVSTVASQGLTNEEKANARSNIGAGTSSFDGNYNSLSNKPTIPTKISQLTNDSGFKNTDNNTTYTLSQDPNDGHKITLTPSSGTPTTVTIPDNNTTYGEATTSSNGLMTSTMVSKLANIADGANKTTVDSALSSTSTNPVQNKVVNSALSGKANSSHTHGNADITGLDAGKITSGTIDIARLPQGALERCVVVADDTARFALTTSKVQVGDTVKVTATGKMYFVTDDTKLSSEAGYEVYTAGSATSVPWSGVTGKPSSYTPSSHTHDDRYYTESEINTKLGGKVDLSDTGVITALNKLSTGTDTPKDADYYIAQYAGGGTTNTNYYRRPVSALWNYIKGKADAVYAKVSHKHTKADITDFPSSLPANGGNASTVNGHSVNSDVPANAKFTDTNTTYGTGNASTSGLTKLYTGTGSATDGTMTQSAISNALGGKMNMNSAGGIATCSGNGQYSYCKIATIKITATYVNRPIVFEISGRGKCLSQITVMFESVNGTDPGLSIFKTNQENTFWIKKASTSTWEVYAQYNETYGSYCLHRITGTGADIGVTVNMANVSSLPSGCTQVSYTGNVGYASSAGSVAWGNVSGKPSLGTASSKAIRTLTTSGPSGWKDVSTDQQYVPDMAFMAYWNGAYSGSSSNLAYCNKGAFGSAATKDTSYFATAGHTHNYAGSSSAGGAANSAVKLATARTISLSGAVSGSANFDGSSNITIATKVQYGTSVPSTLADGVLYCVIES